MGKIILTKASQNIWSLEINFQNCAEHMEWKLLSQDLEEDRINEEMQHRVRITVVKMPVVSQI
jgi:hypothetical protein